jgi:uncharacterized membrane protein (UPF0136 family)
METAVLWIYIVFLLIGGVIGWLLGKSKVSFFFSWAFGIALILCARQVFDFDNSLWLIGILSVVFLMRVLRTHKFMPAGLMLVVTLATLVLLIIF